MLDDTRENKKRVKGIPLPTEEEEQETLASYLDYIGVWYCHVPNGGHRHVAVAKKLKKAGVKPGVPDILIFDPPPAFPEKVGTAIELKRQEGGVVSDDQNDWLDALEKRGWYRAVCEGADEAIKVIRNCGYAP